MNITALSDDNLRLFRDRMLVEPIRPPRSMSLQADIISVDKERLPGTCRAKVLKFGPLTKPVDFMAGDTVCIRTHAGTLLEMPPDHAERMIIEVRYVDSVVCEETETPS